MALVTLLAGDVLMRFPRGGDVGRLLFVALGAVLVQQCRLRPRGRGCKGHGSDDEGHRRNGHQCERSQDLPLHFPPRVAVDCTR